ncbi:MAG: hypothetical protein FIB01_06860 [Gemmatimonadetes bacterium]|nr:hypothetical protein [Gemmatimonadota bacterium]
MRRARQPAVLFRQFRNGMPALALLGRPLLVADGHRVVTGRGAQRHCFALLTLLAGERRGLSRDRIIAYLWPECDAPSARHRLSVTLHVLHEQLGGESILAISDGLALEPSRWEVDAWQFEEAAARGEFALALGSYRGPLLDGFFLRRAPGFEQWLERWRDRLARLHLAVLEGLADGAERQGDRAACVAYRRELVAHDPCSSARNIALMRALVAAAQSEAAVQCARGYALMIREEYGLEPDPAVLASADEVIRNRRAAAAAARA